MARTYIGRGQDEAGVNRLSWRAIRWLVAGCATAVLVLVVLVRWSGMTDTIPGHNSDPSWNRCVTTLVDNTAPAIPPCLKEQTR